MSEPVHIKPGKHLRALYEKMNNPDRKVGEAPVSLTPKQQQVLRCMGHMSRPTIERFIAMARAGAK